MTVELYKCLSCGAGLENDIQDCLCGKLAFTPEQIGHLKHEINNPLTVIRLKLELAQRDVNRYHMGNTDRGHKNLIDALEQVDRIKKFLEDL